MSDPKPFNDFCEKLYFHEIDAREKLHARVNTPLAVLISVVGVLGFMLQNLQRGQAGGIVNLFYGAFLLAFAFVVLAAYYLKSAASGHDYTFLSPPNGWMDYRATCEKLYAEFENKDELVARAVKESIANEYIRCGSINARVNDERSTCLFKTIKCLIIAIFFVLVACILFFFGGLDKAAHPKPTAVTVINPVELKGLAMASDKPAPPPPPPPPPARVVREDRRPNSPPPPPERKHGQ